jgi:hypothetical protein
VSGTGNVYDGQYAVEVGTGAGGVYQDLKGVAPGSYTLSFAGKVGSSYDPLVVGVGFHDVNGNFIGEVEQQYGNTSWQTMTLAIQVPSNAPNLRVYVWKNSGSSFIFADDVSLSFTGASAVLARAK